VIFKCERPLSYLSISLVQRNYFTTFQGKSFEVPAGSLGFSVTIFTLCAVVTVIIIMLRRYIPLFGGELGGPKVPKVICGVTLICIWVLYIVLSSLQAYEHISGF